ncbi:MAG: hypothetical protein GY820_39325 [Gammaproteobacteria bacterium]|nr:hypothetical protein [Gammaproteobacteria bacterium]
MNAEGVSRYIITGLLLIGVLTMMAMSIGMPEWFTHLVALVVGNTFRVQVTQKK